MQKIGIFTLAGIVGWGFLAGGCASNLRQNEAQKCEVRPDNIPPGFTVDQCHCVPVADSSSPQDDDDWEKKMGRSKDASDNSGGDLTSRMHSGDVRSSATVVTNSIQCVRSVPASPSEPSTG